MNDSLSQDRQTAGRNTCVLSCISPGIWGENQPRSLISCVRQAKSTGLYKDGSIMNRHWRNPRPAHHTHTHTHIHTHTLPPIKSSPPSLFAIWIMPLWPLPIRTLSNNCQSILICILMECNCHGSLVPTWCQLNEGEKMIYC